ncbi:MAG: S-adenosylmethionine:tRNA ribosyltransferase-isomerase, partial [Oscillospiraceae bacterium]|nr:S-adenosylmethionine:tRNA ribosyltransferase-isomerase [Oscillospiraceae bacterium]
MKTADFFYRLPPSLIAQRPAEPRDSARMMVLRRADNTITHGTFRSIGDYLRPGDCLILNDTKVLPARLYGVKEATGARVEFLLLNQISQDVWECLAGPGKKARPGARFSFGDGLLIGEVLEALPNGNRAVQFTYEGNFYHLLGRVGEMPLPHYITEQPDDPGRYNTVYARENGSAAAPT